MKYQLTILLFALFIAACSDSTSDHAHHGSSAAADVPDPVNPVTVVDGVTIVEMTGNDRMKFNLESFTVPAGSPVKLIFTNVGRMPKASMGHNVVFLNAGVDANAFVAAAASARDNDYIPSALKDQIFAYTKLLGPGEKDTIEFIAPEVPGEYPYVCSFPAHLFAGMGGVMIVE
ncbi:MAG: azurin [Puniceicoccaceae bacterium]|nr:MAG: azurin [Puniceicoccaceae bacterium]